MCSRISTVHSHSLAAMETQSNNSCQMYVTPATISLATRGAAPTRWELLCCKNNKHSVFKKENLKSEKFRERECKYATDERDSFLSTVCCCFQTDYKQNPVITDPDCMLRWDNSTTVSCLPNNLGVVLMHFAIIPMSIVGSRTSKRTLERKRWDLETQRHC